MPALEPTQPNADTRDLTIQLLGMGAVILIIATYNIFFYDRYLPLTEGWFSAYAHLIRNGYVPYRDFDFFLTPLYPLQLASFSFFFGESIYALRVLGVFIVLAIATLEYLILLRFFAPFSSAFAAITSVIYFQSGVAHITYDFTQVLTLYTLMAFYFFILGIQSQDSKTKNFLTSRLFLLSIAGLFSALAFLTKQSNGTLIVLGVFTATCLSRPFSEWRLSAHDLMAVSLGMLAPMSATLLCLAWTGALRPCIDQIFFGAIESKGHLDHIFFAWMPGFFNSTYVAQLVNVTHVLLPIFTVQALALACFRWWPIINCRGRILNVLGILFILLSCTFSIVFTYFAPPAISKNFGSGGPLLVNYIIPISLTTILILFAIGIIRQFSYCVNTTEVKFLSSLKHLFLKVPSLIFPFSILCLSMVAGNGTSAGLSEVGCFLGLGFFIAWMMSRTWDLHLLKLATLMLFCSYIISLSGLKYESPYSWWFMSQPNIHQATHESKSDLLRGMKVSSETAEIIDSVNSIIQSDVQDKDPIFCFPHIPLFYLLSDHWPTTKAKIHWFDFLPDELARRDAMEIITHPPSAFIYVDLPELAWTTHERLFRDGKSIGQRDISMAIENLTKSGIYTERYAKDLGNDCSLRVWTLNPANQQGLNLNIVRPEKGK